MARIDSVRTVPRPPSPTGPGFAGENGPSHPGGLPLAGVTVLDLGVIVAGAQTGLLFAEQGARVIRVENRQFPDGMRRTFERLTPALARGHMGKESLGLDLRSDEGVRIFKELVRRADVVTSDFKPGTLERLGISHADLLRVKPRIVCVESSAFGNAGPWRTAMGYGPLVRAGSGLTWLWRQGPDSTYFGDGITMYPDHVAARVGAITALACLLDRWRTGVGRHVGGGAVRRRPRTAGGTARGRGIPVLVPVPCGGDAQGAGLVRSVCPGDRPSRGSATWRPTKSLQQRLIPSTSGGRGRLAEGCRQIPGITMADRFAVRAGGARGDAGDTEPRAGRLGHPP
ncbi:CoA transferase [Streptomyces guryensis]|uniref:CoA transferase n=1 Tax=Streptomyces guryensis TaxID=2886947 RepID=A0A9Q3Z8E2_9ACTN|nr:CoA transferase [Streptomyces guryensis]MCD9878458.1 CoA transferase [Streptomyces guryensis]